MATLRATTKERVFGNADSVQTEAEELMSAPMIGDGFITAIETAEPESYELKLFTAAFLAFRVARDVLHAGDFDATMHAKAWQLVRRFPNVTARRAVAGVLKAADGTDVLGASWRTVLVERMTEAGHFFRTESHLPVAVDAFSMASLVREVDPSAHMVALQGRAWTVRQLGHLSLAAYLYRRLRSVADIEGDVTMELDADIGLSIVMAESGDLAEAERLATAVLDRAHRVGLSKIVARAHGQLAYIAGAAERHDDAIVHAHAAVQGPLAAVDRDICTVNIAAAFRQLRRFRAAERFAWRVVRTAHAAEHRAVALVTLYHLSLDHGEDASEFREALLSLSVSVATQAQIHGAVARDHWLADDLVLARRELKAATALTQGATEFDDALQCMDRGEMPILFQQPTAHVISIANAPALRTIEAEIRRAENEASMTVPGRVGFAPAADGSVATQARIVLAR